MNSKLFRICCAIGLSDAVKLDNMELDIDLNDISSIDSYTPSKFMDGIDKIGSPDELITTLADIRIPGELGGMAPADSPSSTSTESSKPKAEAPKIKEETKKSELPSELSKPKDEDKDADDDVK